MTSTWLVLALRLVHIMSAIFWVGGIMVVANFIFPTVKALGPAGAQVMTHLAQVRKLPMRLFVAGWVTVLSGFALYFHAGAVSDGAFYRSMPGRVFGLGGALALAAILMGTFGNMPTTRRIGAVAAQMQSGPTPELAAEMERLQGRLQLLSRIAVVLLLLAAATMAIARYT
jgi:hypothetical protein